MKKIPTVFLRDPETKLRYVNNQVHPDCQWVLDGKGKATVKWNGTCCLIEGGHLYKRREIKPIQKSGTSAPSLQPPPGFRFVEHDSVTGKTVGWLPVIMPGTTACVDDNPDDKWHREAFDRLTGAVVREDDGEDVPGATYLDGTYELLGPKIQGNQHGFTEHVLITHGWMPPEIAQDTRSAPRDFHGLRIWLQARDYEGIVWHHPDGRMAKLKKRDFPA